MARQPEVIVLTDSSESSDSDAGLHTALAKKTQAVFGDYVLSREERYLLAADDDDESDASASGDDDYDDRDDSFGDGARAFARKRQRPNDRRTTTTKRRKLPTPTRPQSTKTKRAIASSSSEDDNDQPFRHSSMVRKMEKARAMRTQLNRNPSKELPVRRLENDAKRGTKETVTKRPETDRKKPTTKMTLSKPLAARKSAAPVNGKVGRLAKKRSRREDDSDDYEDESDESEESAELSDSDVSDREIVRKKQPPKRQSPVEEIEISDEDSASESESESESDDDMRPRRPSKATSSSGRSNGKSASRPPATKSKLLKKPPASLPPKPKPQPKASPRPSPPAPKASRPRNDSAPAARSSRAVASLPENMSIEDMQAQERQLAYFKQLQKKREQSSHHPSTSQPARKGSSSSITTSRPANDSRKAVTTQNAFRLKRQDSAASVESSVSSVASREPKPLAKAKTPMPFVPPAVREGFSTTGTRNVMTTVSIAADASVSFAAEEKVDHIPLPHNTSWCVLFERHSISCRAIPRVVQGKHSRKVRYKLGTIKPLTDSLNRVVCFIVKERELGEFDESNTIPPLPDLASPPKVSTNELLTQSLESQESINAKVRRVIDESLPVLKKCHQRRVHDMIREMRKSLPWYSPNATITRGLRKTISSVRIAGSNDAAPIEQVHEKRILHASLPRAKSQPPNRLVGTICYVLGYPRTRSIVDGEDDDVFERPHFPDTIIEFGEDLAPMRRTCAWISVKTNIQVDDDPILRYIPYLGDKERVNIDPRRYEATTLEKDRAIVIELPEEEKSAGDEGVVKKQTRPIDSWRSDVANLVHATRSAIDDEVMEYLLCMVIKQCGRSDKVIQALREVGGFAEPITDYDVILKREETARAINKRLEHLQRCLDGVGEHASIREYVTRLVATSNLQSDDESISQRLRPPLASFSSNYLQYPDGKGVRNAKSVGLVMEWYRDLFCRRCYTYDCQQHGIQHPPPSRRTDPLNPVVKKSGVGLTRAKKPKGSGENDVIEIESSSSSSEDSAVEEENDDAQSTVSGSVDGEGDAAKAAADRRRSRRSQTRASTLASASLQVQEGMVEKERRKSQRKQAKQLRKLVRQVDDSEYLDDSYRGIVGPTMDLLISPAVETSCSTLCWKRVTQDSSVETPTELPDLVKVMLRKIIPILGDNACIIARLLQTPGTRSHTDSGISCAAIHRYIEAEKTKTDGTNLFASSGYDDRFHDKTGHRRQTHSSRSSTALHSGNRELIRRTRMNRAQQQQKEREHRYEPCNHTGTCHEGVCDCLKRGHDCDKACSCSRDCANRHHGCKCLPGQCRTKSCACYESRRECDPDYCFSCGAHEAAVMEFDADQRHVLASDVDMCRNVSLLRGVHKKIGVAFSAVHGWGAYTLEPVRKGEFVYEYTGALISDDEAERRGNIYDIMKVSYLFDVNSDEVVDAMRKGNKIKFANHKTRELANLDTKILVVRGEHRIALFAKWDLHVGEELFFDYGYTNETAPEWSQLRTPHNPRYADSDLDDDDEELNEVLQLQSRVDDEL